VELVPFSIHSPGHTRVDGTAIEIPMGQAVPFEFRPLKADGQTLALGWNTALSSSIIDVFEVAELMDAPRNYLIWGVSAGSGQLVVEVQGDVIDRIEVTVTDIGEGGTTF